MSENKIKLRTLQVTEQEYADIQRGLELLAWEKDNEKFNEDIRQRIQENKLRKQKLLKKKVGNMTLQELISAMAEVNE